MWPELHKDCYRLIIESLSNHDDDKQQKTHKFAYLTMKNSIFARFWRRSRSFYDVKLPVLQLCGRREHMITNVQFCLLISPRRCFQFNSRIFILEHIFQAWWLWIIEKWLQKREVTLRSTSCFLKLPNIRRFLNHTFWKSRKFEHEDKELYRPPMGYFGSKYNTFYKADSWISNSAS